MGKSLGWCQSSDPLFCDMLSLFTSLVFYIFLFYFLSPSDVQIAINLHYSCHTKAVICSHDLIDKYGLSNLFAIAFKCEWQIMDGGILKAPSVITE